MNTDQPATQAIETAHLRLEYMTGAGPRLLRLFAAGCECNLFANIPQVAWETPNGTYHPHGGHRLWRSPEYPEVTYLPDDQPPQVEALPDGVRITGVPDFIHGLCKTMEVRLDPAGPRVTVDHTITNLGAQAVEIAPWAITQLEPGGWAVAPNTPPRLNTNTYLPDRSLALWPYTRLDDPRLRFMDDLVLVQADATVSPFKIGLRSNAGWLGYYNGGVFFRKQAQPDWGQPYPDFGCNLEVYADNRFLELETLGPLAPLAPGGSLSHRETWQIWAGLDAPCTPEATAELARVLH
jgi:hypothetical protein